MKTISKKELRQNTETTLLELFAKHQVAAPSKRAERLLNKVSKQISGQLKQDIKKQFKKNQRAEKKANSTQESAAA